MCIYKCISSIFIYMCMMSIVRRRSGVSQYTQETPAFRRGRLPTDKGWRKGSRTDSQLLAQVANKTVDAQVDAGRSRGGGGAAIHTRAGGLCAVGPFSMQAKKAIYVCVYIYIYIFIYAYVYCVALTLTRRLDETLKRRDGCAHCGCAQSRCVALAVSSKRLVKD